MIEDDIREASILYAGLMALEANHALCDFLNSRLPNKKYKVVEAQINHIKVALFLSKGAPNSSDEHECFHYSHDALQLVLEVLSTDETTGYFSALERYFQHSVYEMVFALPCQKMEVLLEYLQLEKVK